MRYRLTWQQGSGYVGQNLCGTEWLDIGPPRKTVVDARLDCKLNAAQVYNTLCPLLAPGTANNVLTVPCEISPLIVPRQNA